MLAITGGLNNKLFTVHNGVVMTKAEAAAAVAAEARAKAAAAGGAAGAAAGYPALDTGKSIEERVALIASVGEEVVGLEDLAALLAKKPSPVAYDGFEPSGRMHIAQGLMKAANVNKLTSAGCVFKFWVADWFAMLNNKLGGDLKKIRTVGQYMIEVWKACGMDMSRVEFLWASDEINGNSDAYWGRVMDIATRVTLARVKRCGAIMGRKDGDELSPAQIMYPMMQATDIFHLKADICQLGMDQRKVNMLAREYCDTCKPKIKHKPIIVSHHMLMGLKEGQEKMSKSDPDSAIFMEDTAADVKRKIKRAYCPPGVAEKNPVLDWVKHIVLAREGKFTVKRKPDNGGDMYVMSAARQALALDSRMRQRMVRPVCTVNELRVLHCCSP